MEQLCRHEVKSCPGCGLTFECRAGDVENCQCYGILFTKKIAAGIVERFDACL